VSDRVLDVFGWWRCRPLRKPLRIYWDSRQLDHRPTCKVPSRMLELHTDVSGLWKRVKRTVGTHRRLGEDDRTEPEDNRHHPKITAPTNSRM
jgi:hypothetical protein